MLIAEELRLLFTRADGRPEPGSTFRPFAEIAAVIVELTMRGRVVASADADPKLTVVSREPTGHPALDAVLTKLVDGAPLTSVVIDTKLDPSAEIVASLEAQGIVQPGDRTFFGLGSQRLVEVDPAPEAALRLRLGDVLHGRRAATDADVTVLSLLEALGLARNILRTEVAPLKTREVTAAITRLSEPTAVTGAVTAAVASMNAAMMSTVFVTVVAGDGGSGGGDGGAS